MNTELMTRQPVAMRPPMRRGSAPRPSLRVSVRQATTAEAPALHALITSHVQEGHLLPRALAELAVHAPRFVVAVRRGRLVGCAELAPLSGRVAEVRSLVVERRARSLGIGRALVNELQRRARVEGFEKICAFTHDAGYFVRMGFSIVPHVWVPEKIALDCHSCEQFRRCGQHAVVLPLTTVTRPQAGRFVPLASLRG